MTIENLEQIYHRPLFDLIQESRRVHLEFWDKNEVQLCTLLSVKTGGCSEDCGYCSQSAHHKTGLERQDLMSADEVLPVAKKARENGSTRFCMGAAWKGVREGDQKFEQMLETVRAVSRLGMEVCVTLGQLGDAEAAKLKEAGLTAYNHNIDTSPEHYPNIVTSHTFDDRLNTIGAVQRAGLSVCCGGIIGMGEQDDDVVRMAFEVRDLGVESIPVNFLNPIDGTPLQGVRRLTPRYCLKVLAMFRFANPSREIRIAGGRELHLGSLQALGLYAANSIFVGDYLTTQGQPPEADYRMIEELGFVVTRPGGQR